MRDMIRSDVSDAQLMGRLKEGDQAALGELYDRYAGTAYRTAYRVLGDPGWAEEVVQETMLALWDRAELYDAEVASLAAWLGTIARNRAIDRLRAHGRRVVALPLSAVAGPDEEASGATDRALESGVLLAAGRREQEPTSAAEAAWLRATLVNAVATLPEPERQVIELAYSRDLSQSEIAAHLGWPLGTVKTRTRRALASLRGALADEVATDLGRGSARDGTGGTSAPTRVATGTNRSATPEETATVVQARA
jgi:RNA polymerase sigma-70 factor (ECF subfamily)